MYYIIARNKHAEEHIKSIRAPSGLRLQLDPIKVSEEREFTTRNPPTNGAPSMAINGASVVRH